MHWHNGLMGFGSLLEVISLLLCESGINYSVTQLDKLKFLIFFDAVGFSSAGEIQLMSYRVCGLVLRPKASITTFNVLINTDLVGFLGLKVKDLCAYLLVSKFKH